MQEIWAAADRAVVYGDYCLTWDRLEAAARYESVFRHDGTKERHTSLQRFSRGSPSAFAMAEEGRDFSKSSRYGRKQDQLDLLNVLSRSSGSEWTDPRDRVYGVLGMTRTRRHTRGDIDQMHNELRDH
jgi:hypothetical protein